MITPMKLHSVLAACRAAAAARPLPAHAALARPRLRARMGRAGAGARRQARRCLGRHQRAAGPAPDPGQAEPDRAGAQCRPGGVHRRRARDRLAAGAAAAVGQRQGAAGPAGQLRGGRLRAQARRADAARSLAGRRARGRQPAHPDRPAQHRAGRRGAGSAPAAGRSAHMPPTTPRRRPTSCQRWQQAIEPLDGAGGAAEGRVGRVAAQGLRLPVRLAGPEGGRGARTQARRRADRRRICRRCWRR